MDGQPNWPDSRAKDEGKKVDLFFIYIYIYQVITMKSRYLSCRVDNGHDVIEELHQGPIGVYMFKFDKFFFLSIKLIDG